MWFPFLKKKKIFKQNISSNTAIFKKKIFWKSNFQNLWFFKQKNLFFLSIYSISKLTWGNYHGQSSCKICLESISSIVCYIFVCITTSFINTVFIYQYAIADFYNWCLIDNIIIMMVAIVHYKTILNVLIFVMLGFLMLVVWVSDRC